LLAGPLVVVFVVARRGGAKSHCASSWAGWLPLLPYATVQLLACRGQRIAFCFLNARLPPQSPTTS